MAVQQNLSQEPFTRGILIRAFLKALCLFLLFNLVYAQLQLVTQGRLPSLYNHVFPGRERFLKSNEFDAYRLVSDHEVMQARSDHFNIIFLGSSEIWGSRTGPQESIPSLMNRLGLKAADGRPVRVYNLGYPFPAALKDLILMDVVVQYHLPIDLIIVSTFDASLNQNYMIEHSIVMTNSRLSRSIVERYGLPAHYNPAPITEFDAGPVFKERSALANWLSMQMRGFLWTVMERDDVDAFTLVFRRFAPGMTQFLDPITLDRMQPQDTILSAYEMFQQQTHIPLIILEAPVPVDSNAFAPWLQQQTESAGLPLLDCWQVFDLSQFEDMYHITRETHDPYAAIIARHLTDARLAALRPGLPLRLPIDTPRPESSCVWYLPRPGGS